MLVALLGNVYDDGVDEQADLRNLNVLLQVEKTHLQLCNLFLHRGSHLIPVSTGHRREHCKITFTTHHLFSRTKEINVSSPVGFARLPDVGLEERSNSIADERVKSLVGGILAQGQHPNLSGYGLVCVNDTRPLYQSQAGKEGMRSIWVQSNLR